MILYELQGQRQEEGEGQGEMAPLRFQEMEKLENMGYFHAWELTKLAFLSSNNNETHTLRGLLS